MKALSHDEINKLPQEVRFIYMMSLANQSVGVSVFQKAVEKYPEYFEEEIEYRKKYENIPKWAWVQYEYFNNIASLSLNIEPSPGIGSPDFGSWYSRNRPLMEQMEIEREDNFKKYIQPFLD